MFIRFLLAFLIPAYANAAGMWQRFDMPDRAGYWEIDGASITPTKDNHLRLLARITFSGIQKNEAKGTYWDHGVLIAEVDCVRMMWKVVNSVAYLRAERVDTTEDIDQWHPLPKTSPVDIAACGK